MRKQRLYSSRKYLAVVTANGLLLTGLLALWTDSLELTFHEFVRPIEFLKVLGISLLAVGAMFLTTLFWRKRPVKGTTKVLVASLLTVTISSGLYIDYSRRVLHNVILRGQIRTQVAEKITPSHGLAHGTRADHLSGNEYREITITTGFPGVPPAATNIRYNYQYDGFLPDYSLDISYDVLITTNISPSQDSSGRYQRYQTIKVAGDHKRVSYHEDIH
jgi:hypothetical protein